MGKQKYTKKKRNEFYIYNMCLITEQRTPIITTKSMYVYKLAVRKNENEINSYCWDFPYELGHDLQFLPEKGFFSRIKYGLKYIFGRYDDEQHFEIDISTADKLKGMITVVKLENLKDETTN